MSRQERPSREPQQSNRIGGAAEGRVAYGIVELVQRLLKTNLVNVIGDLRHGLLASIDERR